MPSIESLFYQYWKLALAFLIGAILFYSQLSYWLSLYRKEVKPTYLSWLGWGILMGISLLAQVVAKGWTTKITGLLVSTIGCFIIGVSARFIFRHYKSDKKDWNYLYFGVLCMAVYFLSKDEWVTSAVAIVADAILAIPTVKNAVKQPEDEKTKAWILALTAWLLTLILVFYHFNWLHMLWPLYLIVFNSTMTTLTYIRPWWIQKKLRGGKKGDSSGSAEL